MNYLEELEELEEIKKCPTCKSMVKYGDMIWLNGLCTCPKCYEVRREDLDKCIELDRLKAEAEKEKEEDEEEL